METALWNILIKLENYENTSDNKKSIVSMNETPNPSHAVLTKKQIGRKKWNQSSRDCRKRLLQLANGTTCIIKQPTIQVACIAYQQKSSAHLMAYLHAYMGAPVVKIYINAIKNNWLTTFLGLTVESVNKTTPTEDNTNHHGTYA